MIVVKVGGSLFEISELGERLKGFCQSLSEPVCVVAGGGRAADLVRQWDRLHRLGDDAAHWLALEAMSLNGKMLSQIVSTTDVKVADIMAFMRDDEKTPDALPHSWQVTSDSVAARFAVRCGAAKLILLKSAPPPLGTVGDWSVAGYVDPWFPRVLHGHTISISALDFRSGERS